MDQYLNQEEQNNLILQKTIILTLDIGGTLTKVGLYCKDEQIIATQDIKQIFSNKITISTLNKSSQKLLFTTFIVFQDFISFLINSLIPVSNKIKIIATGGGSLKFKSRFEQLTKNNPNISYSMSLNQFQVIFSAIDMLTQEKYSTYIETNKLKNTNQSNKSLQKLPQFPFILANIGSGISILKVEKINQKIEYSRIGGSALGGGYLTGLQVLCNPQFQFTDLDNIELDKVQYKDNPIQQQQIIQTYVSNIYQITSLYADINNLDKIIITGGLTKSQMIRNMFIQQSSLKKSQELDMKQQNKQQKNIFFTQLDQYLGTLGLLCDYLKKANQII